MARIKDITGQRFGRLVVIGIEGKTIYPTSTSYFWKCQCDCGNLAVVRGMALKRQSTQSCGCIRKELAASLKKTHNLRGHSLYSVWNAMVFRCSNPKDKRFHDYGGRGITVCERWLSLENFINDMGDRPEGTSIERIDNNLGYSPENCKWATRTEQQRNKRTNVLISFNGETKCITQWATEIGISATSLRNRLKKQWPLAKALSAIKKPGQKRVHDGVAA